MKEYAIIFDFKTLVDEDLEDISLELNFIPTINMSIWLHDDFYQVDYVDYLTTDDVFIVGMKDI